MSGAEPQVGDRLGRYVLVEILGRGGMGTVFRARDEALERDVAVKVIHPQLAVEGEFRERFRREAVLLSAMDSPHVVAVHDHGVGADWVRRCVPGDEVGMMVPHGLYAAPADTAWQLSHGRRDARALALAGLTTASQPRGPQAPATHARLAADRLLHLRLLADRGREVERPLRGGRGGGRREGPPGLPRAGRDRPGCLPRRHRGDLREGRPLAGRAPEVLARQAPRPRSERTRCVSSCMRVRRVPTR